ncbi:MAG TPA: hypothetical protein ENF17_10145 [Candidatus Aminicenantes bacterium]|nr:hypothetical protein [Candidatus Aminicenantes bacterium]
MSPFSRRSFLGVLPLGFLGWKWGHAHSLSIPQDKNNEQAKEIKIKKYNPLGNTGLKVSDVSFGAISLFDSNVIRYAYDLGVNYFDTAESYLRMQSEKFVGEALGDVRSKVIITTKHSFPPQFKDQFKKERIIQRVENSLSRLQTDYIDIAMIHNISDLSLLENQELQAAYSQLKEQGKIRFTGFSTHNPKLTLKQALTSDFPQVILVIYNHLEGPEIEDLIAQVRKKGIGVVAMKVFAGGKQGNLKALVNARQSYPQAAIRWVLKNPNVDCCIVTMSSYSHVEEYVAVSGQALRPEDLKIISAYQKAASREYCRVSCSACLSACPSGVAINDVLRMAMYFEDYRLESEAIRYYAQLDDSQKPISCATCPGYCQQACPYQLAVKDKLLKAHSLLQA